MDWFSEWQPVPNLEIDRAQANPYLGELMAWAILIVLALVVTAVWYRQRRWRVAVLVSATVGRDVEVRWLQVRMCGVLLGIRTS